jgi:hypothetical protein
MNPARIVLIVILTGWASMLYAQVGCLTQIKPIRPITAGPNAAALCLCAQNNTGCHWQWAAPPAGQAVQAPYPPPVQSDTSIYRITPLPQSQPVDFMQRALEAEKLRALRLENQQRQQEIQRDTQSSALPAIIPTAPVVPPSPNAGVVLAPPPEGGFTTFGMGNGNLWVTMNAHEKLLYVNAIESTVMTLGRSAFLPKLSMEQLVEGLDRFYSDREWIRLPILDAVNAMDPTPTPH